MDKFPDLKKPSHLISTFFGVGLLPLVPGTWGSLVGFLLFLFLIELNFTYLIFFITATFFILSSFFIIENATKKVEEKDHKSIVLDEISGLWLSYLLLPFVGAYDFNENAWSDQTLTISFFLFLAFRFFDILKPWPISYIDKKFKSGFGVVMDDLIAGIFSFLSVASALFIFDFYSI